MGENNTQFFNLFPYFFFLNKKHSRTLKLVTKGLKLITKAINLDGKAHTPHISTRICLNLLKITFTIFFIKRNLFHSHQKEKKKKKTLRRNNYASTNPLLVVDFVTLWSRSRSLSRMTGAEDSSWGIGC